MEAVSCNEESEAETRADRRVGKDRAIPAGSVRLVATRAIGKNESLEMAPVCIIRDAHVNTIGNQELLCNYGFVDGGSRQERASIEFSVSFSSGFLVFMAYHAIVIHVAITTSDRVNLPSNIVTRFCPCVSQYVLQCTNQPTAAVISHSISMVCYSPFQPSNVGLPRNEWIAKVLKVLYTTSRPGASCLSSLFRSSCVLSPTTPHSCFM